MSELAWAAGLFEGEGCISIVKNSKSKFGLHAKLCLQTNDKDVVVRFMSVFEGRGRLYYRPPRDKSKESWAWTAYTRKDVKEIILCLYPWLMERRRFKCDEALVLIKEQDEG